MTFQVIHSPDGGYARSPFRVIEQPIGREVDWINRFLDRECVRRLAENTLRSYAMDLLHFLRWRASLNDNDAISEELLSGTVLVDYLRFQAGPHPQRRSPGARLAERVSRCGQPLRARVSPFLLAAVAAGLWPPSPGPEPHAGKGAQTHHRSPFGG
jgi:hypothetical protein